MPKKYKIILKSIGRKWFIILVVVIIIIFIINQQVAIWMTIITIGLYILSYVPDLFFSNKLQRYIKAYNSLDDITIAKKFNRSLDKIQEKMFDLSQKQNKKTWLIIFLNKQYIFYNEDTIEKFKEQYNQGLGEKEILEQLRKYNVNTRAEVKSIEETLIKADRLTPREISVKDYREKKRFS